MADLVGLTAEHVARRLREETVIWLTTVTAGGQPQSSPVWFLWDGASFLIYSRPNQKMKNLAGGGKVALNLNHHGGEDVVTIEGYAEPAADMMPLNENSAYMEKYSAHITRIGWEPERFAAAYSAALRVTPTRARVW